MAVVLGIGSSLRAQEGHGVTPVDIERGAQIYLSNCSSCHGPNGDGVTGVYLFSGQFRKATTDEDLVNVIKHGIAGTPMPPFNFQDAQAGQIVAYLRSQPATMAASKLTGLRGDPAGGKLIFEGRGEFEGGGGCLGCHRLQTPSGKVGGFLGPDLSNIGAIRRSIDLERALTEPSAAVRTDQRVVVVTRDGKAFRGRLLNQDTYSVQLLDNDGALQSIQKSNVRNIEILSVSVMPNFADRYTKQQLADLVAYLGSLKAPTGRGTARSGLRRCVSCFPPSCLHASPPPPAAHR
jgi:putative heme-binding domain-containing protein